MGGQRDPEGGLGGRRPGGVRGGRKGGPHSKPPPPPPPPRRRVALAGFRPRGVPPSRPGFVAFVSSSDLERHEIHELVVDVDEHLRLVRQEHHQEDLERVLDDSPVAHRCERAEQPVQRGHRAPHDAQD